MILLTTLLLTIIFLTVVTVAVVSITGAAGIILFGDVIVCVLILAWIIKRILKK